MLILSNALTKVVDEGCVKVAYNLVKRIKEIDGNVKVIAFDRQSSLADEYMTVNKLLINRKLISKVKQNKGNVVYFPFPAKTRAIALRIFILSLFAGKNFRVILSMTSGMDFLSKVFFKMSRAKFVVFSKSSFELYCAIVGTKNVTYIKTGVDTEKFIPVPKERADELKRKYGFDPAKKLVLHVGHINRGRNVQQLCKLTVDYQVLLVSSTLTQDEQDLQLKNELVSSGVKLIDAYISDIEQIYQMADVYLFPVVERGRCIDVPLSCMEAAACNKPIVTTDFGEMREFRGVDGFYFIDSFSVDKLNQRIDQALHTQKISTRPAVLDYDWRFAVNAIREG